MKRILFILFTFLLLVCTEKTKAQFRVDTINATNHSLLIHKLKESTAKYWVYFTDSSKQKRKGVGDIWERKITKEKLNNKDVIKFTWNWITSDEIVKHTINILDAKTLSPITYFAINKTPKRTDTSAYIFEKDYLRKDKTVKGNTVNDDFEKELNIPVLNWELDLETYPLFRIKKIGQIFDVAFFDVNESAPVYHRYKVIGEDKLESIDHIPISCWLLKIDYDEKNNAIFWLSKKTGEMIKSEEKVVFGNNSLYSFKVKLPAYP